MRDEYLIVYAPDEKPLWVVAVLHGRRNPRLMAAILSDEEPEPASMIWRPRWRISIGTQIVGEDEQGVARVINREGNDVGGAAFWPERWREVAATVPATSNGSRDRVHDDVMVVAGHEA